MRVSKYKLKSFFHTRASLLPEIDFKFIVTVLFDCLLNKVLWWTSNSIWQKFRELELVATSTRLGAQRGSDRVAKCLALLNCLTLISLTWSHFTHGPRLGILSEAQVQPWASCSRPTFPSVMITIAMTRVLVFCRLKTIISAEKMQNPWRLRGTHAGMPQKIRGNYIAWKYMACIYTCTWHVFVISNLGE